MNKYIFSQSLEMSEREGSVNRLAIQANMTGNVKDRDKTIQNISKLCNNSIKEYMDNIEEWRR